MMSHEERIISMGPVLDDPQHHYYDAATGNNTDGFDDDNASRSSSRSMRSLKKGMKKFGKNVKKVFSPNSKKRNRRRGKNDNGDDDGSSLVSYDSSYNNNNGGAIVLANGGGGNGNYMIDTDTGQEWVDAASNNGGVESAAAYAATMGRPSRPSRISELPKVIEGDDEDYDSDSPLKNSSHRNKKNYGSITKKRLSKKKKKGKSPRNGSARDESNSSVSSFHSGGGSGAAVAPYVPNTAASTNDVGKKADPLSLVILLVDPTSLRFELLSLDFDLAAAAAAAESVTNDTTTSPANSKKKKNKRLFRKNKNTANNNDNDDPSSSSVLTVQDVLDQITPESVTEETLKANLASAAAAVSTPNNNKEDDNKNNNKNKLVPIGLIDRNEQIHYGTTNLEDACCGTTSSSKAVKPISLSNLTYNGEPHRDVLLGFLGDPKTDLVPSSSSTKTTTSEVTKEKIRKAIDLARPIFNDTNVVRLMESNGYNLIGWSDKAGSIVNNHPNTMNDVGDEDNSISRSIETSSTMDTMVTSSTTALTTTTSPNMLREPLPAKKRSKRWLEYKFVKFVLGLLVFLSATVTAWSIVSGGMYVLPSISRPVTITTTTPSIMNNSGSTNSTDNNTVSNDTSSSSQQQLPKTMEGFLKLGFDSVSSWIQQQYVSGRRMVEEYVVVVDDKEQQHENKDDNNNNNGKNDHNNDEKENNEIIDLDQM